MKKQVMFLAALLLASSPVYAETVLEKAKDATGKTINVISNTAQKAKDAVLGEASPAAGGTMDAHMQEMMKLTQPAEQHKILEPLVGDWTYVSRMWEKPNAAAQESTGTNSNKWIMDGRFVEQHYEGTMVMNGQSMPFKGMGIMGYNNMKKHYESIWLDNMTTGIMTGKGHYDAETKTISEEGTYSCPMKGEMDAKYRSELKLIDNDHHSFTMYAVDKASGKEFKGMEIVYTRK